MAKTIALSQIEHASYFESIKPDLLLIVGDRFDMVGPALSASIMNIPIIHIQGGETSGTIDNTIRDLITRMSSLHFVSTQKSVMSSLYTFACVMDIYFIILDLCSIFLMSELWFGHKCCMPVSNKTSMLQRRNSLLKRHGSLNF